MTIQLSGSYLVESDEIFSGAPAFYIEAYGDSITLENYGLITSTTAGVYSWVSRGLILNAGRIAVEGPGSVYGLYSPQWAADVDNRGSITVSGVNASGMETWSPGQVFKNSGTLTVTAANTAMGLLFRNGGTITNTGSISVTGGGPATGIFIDRFDGGYFENAGDIIVTSNAGASHGLKISGLDYPNSGPNIVNRGVIKADIAIYSYSAGYSPAQELIDYIVNYGTIEGDIVLTLGADVVRNQGLLIGDIDTGAGDDLVDVSSGRFVGSITLGEGADTATGSAAGELIVGGGGRDMLRGLGGADILRGDEGSDFSSAGSGNDIVEGGSGSDTLEGGAGDDILIGGTGDNRLTGGTVADLFSGSRAELANDTILDFSFNDTLNITDANPGAFAYTLAGTSLVLGTGEVITLANAPVGGLMVQADGKGGVLLSLAASAPLALAATAGDFNGDGVSDLAWRNSSGVLAVWNTSVQGGVLSQTPNVFVNSALLTTSHKLAAAADFDGDGDDDLLWRTLDGDVQLWTSTGTGFSTTGGYGVTVSDDWTIAATGDFTGDGKEDLIWRQAAGGFSEWRSNGAGFDKNIYVNGNVDASWGLVGAGDFTGDGKDDLLWRGAGGTFTIWASTGTSFAANVVVDGSVSNAWSVTAIGDFNGDGKDDLLWRNQNGAFSEWLSTGAGFDKNVYVDGRVGTDWTQQSVGDFNGDGKDDLLWRSDRGVFTIWAGQTTGFAINSFVDGSVPNAWALATNDFDLV